MIQICLLVGLFFPLEWLVNVSKLVYVQMSYQYHILKNQGIFIKDFNGYMKK